MNGMSQAECQECRTTPPGFFSKYREFFDVLLLALACAVLAGAGVVAVGALIYGALWVINHV